MHDTIDYIINKLDTIPDLDNVYECLPLAGNRNDLLLYFDDNLQGWEVSNFSGSESFDIQNALLWSDVIRIDGWYLYKDSTTRRQMQTFIQAIKVLFKNDLKLGNTVRSRGVLRLIFNQTDWFYEILTHHCRFEIGVSAVY